MRITVIILALLFAAKANATHDPAFSLTELKGEKADSVRIDHWKGQPLLVAFWRSDCAPCLQEMKLLPDMAQAHPTLIFLLISLHDAEHTRAHLPALSPNVHVLVGEGDLKELLSSFGNTRTLALPYSVMLDKGGNICGKHYGILSPKTITQWQATCSK
jgi:thiol-disulfide isomerase/thioredoxin